MNKFKWYLTRLKWALKVLKAKHFLLLTDKESIISLSGVDPRNLNDELKLQQQSLEIENFLELLQDFQAEHEKRIARLRRFKTPMKGNEHGR